MSTEHIANDLINETSIAQQEDIQSTHIYIWDLPLRIFHWLLVAAVSIAIVTAKLGGNWMDIHGKAGLTIVGLLAFRVIWGFIGPHHSRFLVFFPKPKTIIQYIKGHWVGYGHNPIGALATIILLSVLIIQAISGLFSNNDIDFVGPLTSLISESVSRQLTKIHHLSANLLYGLLITHIVAIVLYLILKKNNLIKPMITGWKKTNDSSATISERNNGSIVVKFIIALFASLVIVYFVSGKSSDTTHTPSTVTNTPSW
jgi:cytochrome b